MPFLVNANSYVPNRSLCLQSPLARSVIACHYVVLVLLISARHLLVDQAVHSLASTLACLIDQLGKCGSLSNPRPGRCRDHCTVASIDSRIFCTDKIDGSMQLSSFAISLNSIKAVLVSCGKLDAKKGLANECHPGCSCASRKLRGRFLSSARAPRKPAEVRAEAARAP